MSSLKRAPRCEVKSFPMEFVFNSFVTLLVVIDPLGLAPIFGALTQGFSEKQKRESAIRGTLLGALILFVFALVGDVLLEALGIGLPAFRIAGGLLLFLLSLDMVFARPSGMRATTVRERRPAGLAKTMSSERRKRSMPPAMRKAGMPMPKAESSTSPTSAKIRSIAVPRMVPLTAVSRLRLAG